MKRPFFGIMFTLLLTSMSALAGVSVTTGSNDHAVRQAADGQDTSFSVGPYKKFWDFSKATEWRDFVKISNGSIEMIIGINYTKPNGYGQLRRFITENQGELVKTVSMNSEITAAVACVPVAVAPTFAEEVRNNDLSRYVEPNLRFQACLVPNDPYWPQQWGPATIETDCAWDTTMGYPSILVAVIDTGIDHDHRDLAGNYVPLGYDWVNNDTDPMDDFGHGTHCAGIIAALTYNGIGVAGLAQVRIMAEKGLDEHGGGYADDLANAIIHAVDQGADILSLSWGGYVATELIHDALKYAYDAGVVVVAAAGNDAADIVHFPAYHEEVIAVTATNRSDDLASFSTFGKWVELAAPGVDIFSTIWDDDYGNMSGTSMACPHVSGVAALLLSRCPHMSRDQVRLQLRRTADDLGEASFDVYYGYGRVNARRAVEESPSTHDLHVWEWKRPPYVEPGDTASFNVTVLNFGLSDEHSIMVRLLVNDTVVNSALINSLSSGATATVSLSWNPLALGRYNVTAHVIPVSGENYTVDNIKSAYVNVRPGKFIMVPLDCAKIQEAVELARLEEVIHVASGTYYEHVYIDKSVKLVGENCNTTIIDANETGSSVTIIAEKVCVDGFTLQNSVKTAYVALFTGGAVLIGVKDCLIVNNRLLNNYEGVVMIGCDGNITVSNNLIDGFHDAGVGAAYGDLGNNSICRNTIVNPLHNITFGIVLVGTVAWPNSAPLTTDNNIISGNTVISHMKSQQHGILLALSHNNSVTENTLMINQFGIFSANSKDNKIAYNNITNNYCGINELHGIFGGVNTFHHNNMINNTVQAESPFDPNNPYNNTWHWGYPSGGNYWSDYNGTDLYSGPHQNETGSDGIGDTAYTIDEDDRGHYPLMTPYPCIHAVAVKDVRPGRAVLGQGLTTKIRLDVANQGHFTETFNVTAYANTTIIDQTEVTLTGMNSTAITSTWNTTGFALGNYTIMAVADVVANETYTADNTHINGMTTVRSPIHDVAVVDASPASNVILRGFDLNIRVIVENPGDFVETFNITVYANTTTIGQQEVVLDPGESTILTFAWNTTWFSLGNYIINASATPVAEETNTDDNTYTGGIVMVRLSGHVAILDVTPSKTVVAQGYSLFINVTVENHGDFEEDFNVTAHADLNTIATGDEITIGVQNPILTSGNSTTLTFIWNVTSVAKGNYTISAYADPVPGEIDLADNTKCGDQRVCVTIPGDVDGDFDGDLYDAVKLLVRYGAKQDNQKYDPNCDIDGDGDIDLYDAVILLTNYGKKDP